MVKAIVGANWGDEGKGKVTDLFAAQSDVVVRFQGGANAGHTIINDYGKFALHQLPSGVFFPHVTNIIGNGVALNINAFISEISYLKERGVKDFQVLISDRAQIVMPYHILMDQYEEERLSDRKFGSTKSGIAPFYADKYAKTGIQVCELFDEEALKPRLENICLIKNTLIEHLYHNPKIDPKALLDTLMEYRGQIAPYVCDTFVLLSGALKAGKTILLEGQLGSLRDPDFGIYPYSTSSHTVAGFGCVGAGVPPGQIDSVICVTKAYSSAVGAGEFVTELFGAEAETLREKGGDAGEYGATTGRPRRVGWFDSVATRFGCAVQGGTEVVLTNIDVLGYLDEIKVCTGYEIDGQVTRDFPVTPKLKRAKPVYTALKGWKSDIRGFTDWNALPPAAKDYVGFIEEQVGLPIRLVSTGPRRDEILKR